MSQLPVILVLIAILAGCNSEVTCKHYNFNGTLEKGWSDCSDGKKYAIECDVKDGTFSCACSVDGEKGKDFSYTNKDYPWRGLKKKELGGKASELCGWNELKLADEK